MSHELPPSWQRIALIGVGLIGGSFALALRRARPNLFIVGCDRDQINLASARQLGVIDQALEDPLEAVRGAQFILIAVPVKQTGAVLQAILPGLDPAAVVSDVGSVKGSVVAAARQVLNASLLERFIPAHPIAGAEQSGVRAARDHLFDGRRVILTPLPETDPLALAQVHQAWLACGAVIESMGIEEHDSLFGVISHLPHLLSFSLVHEIASRPDAERLFRFAAGGFRDFSRIAGSNAEMWRDISLANREPLLQELARYQAVLEQVTRMIENRDATALENFFRRAREARRSWHQNQT